MALPSYSTGTVSIGSNATAVVGSGTLWNDGNVKAGDTLIVAGHQVLIEDLTDATHLVIDAWPFTAVAGGTSYKIVQNSPLRFAGAQAMLDAIKVLQALNTDGYVVTVLPTETVPNPSYGDENQYAYQWGTGKLWIKTGGAWVFVGAFKGFVQKGTWSGATAYVSGDIVTFNGSSYLCILDHTNQTPPNVTYWQLLASIPWNPIPVAWATATAYTATAPASTVVQGGETYVCIVSHTSGTFATDLAALKWIKVAAGGATGSQGPNGTSPGVRFAYSTTTTDADPGAGTFRLNNATPASATAAYIDNTDVGAVTVTSFLDQFDDSTATTKGYVRFQHSTNPNIWAQYRVTGSVVDGTGYRKLTLSNGIALGTFVAADVFSLTFYRTGDNGGGGDMLAANNLSDLASIPTAVKNLGLRHGQCVLTKISTNLVLSPKNGNYLTVNGAPATVPDAGVSLTATGLTPATLYYIYATASGGVINALEASTTAPAVSTTAGNKGVVIKSGDDTRTLVGFARPITGPAWVDTAAQRLVRSWFNDAGIDIAGATTTAGTSSSSFTEVSTAARAEFLIWAGEQLDVSCLGTMTDTAGANSMAAVVCLDGTSSLGQPVAFNNYVTNARCGFHSRCVTRTLSEGYHSVSPMLRSISSTAASFNSDSGALVTGSTKR